MFRCIHGLAAAHLLPPSLYRARPQDSATGITGRTRRGGSGGSRRWRQQQQQQQQQITPEDPARALASTASPSGSLHLAKMGHGRAERIVATTATVSRASSFSIARDTMHILPLAATCPADTCNRRSRDEAAVSGPTEPVTQGRSTRARGQCNGPCRLTPSAQTGSISFPKGRAICALFPYNICILVWQNACVNEARSGICTRPTADLNNAWPPSLVNHKGATRPCR